jgi:hypothetical protein
MHPSTADETGRPSATCSNRDGQLRAVPSDGVKGDKQGKAARKTSDGVQPRQWQAKRAAAYGTVGRDRLVHPGGSRAARRRHAWHTRAWQRGAEDAVTAAKGPNDRTNVVHRFESTPRTYSASVKVTPTPCPQSLSKHLTSETILTPREQVGREIEGCQHGSITEQQFTNKAPKQGPHHVPREFEQFLEQQRDTKPSHELHPATALA